MLTSSCYTNPGAHQGHPPKLLALVWVLVALAEATEDHEPVGVTDSVRTAHRAPPAFQASVSTAGGGIIITTAGGNITIGSKFSRPGPVWSTLSGDESAAGWADNVRVTETGPGSWVVSSENPAMTLQRKVTVMQTHIAVADTLTARLAPVGDTTAWTAVAIQTVHAARFTTNATVTSAELPGALYPFSCSTIENQDEYENDGMAFGSFGTANCNTNANFFRNFLLKMQR